VVYTPTPHSLTHSHTHTRTHIPLTHTHHTLTHSHHSPSVLVLSPLYAPPPPPPPLLSVNAHTRACASRTPIGRACCTAVLAAVRRDVAGCRRAPDRPFPRSGTLTRAPSAVPRRSPRPLRRRRVKGGGGGVGSTAVASAASSTLCAFSPHWACCLPWLAGSSLAASGQSRRGSAVQTQAPADRKVPPWRREGPFERQRDPSRAPLGGLRCTRRLCDDDQLSAQLTAVDTAFIPHCEGRTGGQRLARSESTVESNVVRPNGHPWVS